MQLLLSVFWIGSLTAIVTLLVTVKWPSSVWNTKMVAAGIYPPFFAILFFDINKVHGLSVFTLLVVAAVLILLLVLSVRYWQKNGLRCLS